MLKLYIIDPSAPMPISQALLVSAVGIAVVLAELAFIALFIKLLSEIFKKVFAGKKVEDDTQPVMSEEISSAAGSGDPLPETQSQGTVDLIDVDEPTAAVIMAVVSEKIGIPLNRLDFKSIKLAGEEEKK